MAWRLVAIALLACGLGSGPAAAVVVASVDAAALVKNSDLIVVGRARDVKLRVDAVSATETFVLSVYRVMKPDGPSAGSVRIRLDVSSEASAAVAESQLGIFFLRRVAGTGAYEATDPAYPSLPASQSSGVAAAANGDVLAAVARELAAVLTTPREEQEYFETATALKSLPYPSAAAALENVARAGQPAARLWALNCLLSMADPGAVGHVKTTYLRSVRSILADPGPDLALAASMLERSLSGRSN